MGTPAPGGEGGYPSLAGDGPTPSLVGYQQSATRNNTDNRSGPRRSAIGDLLPPKVVFDRGPLRARGLFFGGQP